MTKALLSLRMLAIVACAATAGAAGAALALLARTDTLLAGSFEAALASRGSMAHALPAGDATAGAQPREWLWLSHLEADRPSGALGGLSAGDRISIAGTDGHERRLEVISVAPIDDGVTRSTASAPARLELVTARLIDERATRVVRFIIDADEASTSTGHPARPNRSL